jgi:hypothetical protein
MNTFVTETEDLVDYLAGIERAKRPKKAKSLKTTLPRFCGIASSSKSA